MSNIAIVLGSFHKKEVTEMLEAARAVAAEKGHTIVEEVWVPGSMEKPLALKRLLLRDDVDGAVALGIIENGETKHGLVMGKACVEAIVQLQLEFMKPIGLGILGPGIQPSQIPARIVPYGRDAMLATDHMLALS